MKRSIFITIVLVLLASCSGDENSITGTSDYVLSGQILAVGNLAAGNGAIAAMGNGPVSGVEVRAKGTGVAAVSDPNGRFMLFGLPSSVDLSFTRGDGINASARANVAANPVVTVELQKDKATVVPTGQNKREIEGLISAITPTSITVNDARTKQDVTAEVTLQTIIRHGNQMLTTANLNTGDRVHVRAAFVDNVLVALEIKLQNAGDNGAAVKQLEGLIITVSCSEILVKDASRGPTSALITPQTKIRHGNRNINCLVLKTDDRVHVKVSSGAAGALTALEIKLQNPA